MSGGELSEKAQFSLYCQDSYNAIIKAHQGPLPTDKSQIWWIGPRFLKVRLFSWPLPLFNLTTLGESPGSPKVISKCGVALGDGWSVVTRGLGVQVRASPPVCRTLGLYMDSWSLQWISAMFPNPKQCNKRSLQSKWLISHINRPKYLLRLK